VENFGKERSEQSWVFLNKKWMYLSLMLLEVLMKTQITFYHE